MPCKVSLCSTVLLNCASPLDFIEPSRFDKESINFSKKTDFVEKNSRHCCRSNWSLLWALEPVLKTHSQFLAQNRGQPYSTVLYLVGVKRKNPHGSTKLLFRSNPNNSEEQEDNFLFRWSHNINAMQ